MMKATKLTTGAGTLALTMLICAGNANAVLPPHNDPDLEISRVRCQIDIDIDPVTGVESPKVQIQGKARSEPGTASAGASWNAGKSIAGLLRSVYNRSQRSEWAA